MQIPLANIHWRFLLVRDDWGFQVNPLCRHDITSPFPPSGNEGYVRNRGRSLALSHVAAYCCRYAMQRDCIRYTLFWRRGGNMHFVCI